MRLAIIVPTFSARRASWHAYTSNQAVSLFTINHRSFACTSKNWAWQKEALINDAIRNLPDYDCVGWLDNDIDMPVGWFPMALKALQAHKVVQLFNLLEDLDENGNRRATLKAAAWPEGGILHRTPGGGVALHKDILPEYGLYDRHPRADALFMDACFGRHDRELRSLPWADYARPFCEHIADQVRENVGCLEVTARHRWHGDRIHKKEQVELLSRHQFDAANDLKIGNNGLLEWASDKPELHAAMREYLSGDTKWQRDA